MTTEKKNYLAIYLATGSKMEKWKMLDDKTRQEKEKAGINAWYQWVEKNQKSIVQVGTPIGKTKLINPNGVSDTKNQITAYTVIQAESHQAAAEIFLKHPHFTIFPGDSVEVMECLPMPQK